MYGDNGLNSENGNGIVLSDLHVFTRQSRAADCLRSLRAELACVDAVVLNGDTFDFRWSTLRDRKTTVSTALDWLRALVNDLPRCRIHYVLGNHDWLADFRDQLASLAATLPRLRWHEYFLRLGSALFLHGDCVEEEMDPDGLRRYRAPWANERQRGVLFNAAYVVVDSLGLTLLPHKRRFHPSRAVRRVVHYLDCAWPGWQREIRECYFGHTHMPFTDYRHDGVVFHNSGSAMRGHGFNPLRFQLR